MVLNVGQRQSATQIGRDHDSFIGMKVQGMILFSHLTDLAGRSGGSNRVYRPHDRRQCRRKHRGHLFA